MVLRGEAADSVTGSSAGAFLGGADVQPAWFLFYHTKIKNVRGGKSAVSCFSAFEGICKWISH